MHFILVIFLLSLSSILNILQFVCLRMTVCKLLPDPLLVVLMLISAFERYFKIRRGSGRSEMLAAVDSLWCGGGEDSRLQQHQQEPSLFFQWLKWQKLKWLKFRSSLININSTVANAGTWFHPKDTRSFWSLGITPSQFLLFLPFCQMCELRTV